MKLFATEKELGVYEGDHTEVVVTNRRSIQGRRPSFGSRVDVYKSFHLEELDSIRRIRKSHRWLLLVGGLLLAAATLLLGGSLTGYLQGKESLLWAGLAALGLGFSALLAYFLSRRREVEFRSGSSTIFVKPRGDIEEFIRKVDRAKRNRLDCYRPERNGREAG